EKQLPILMQGDETILLVEDDPGLQQIVKKLLEKYGYRVLVAQDGVEGLDQFRNSTEPIHLVLSDVIMPRKNGIEMIQEINELCPGIPVVFMSGYAADFIEQIQNTGQTVHYISKPLKLPLLLKMMRDALTSAKPLLLSGVIS
ncbi:MAG: response regulator, partial [Pelobacteraceae bacterium]